MHKKGLNIAFFGSSLVSAYWNGAATYYRGIIRAMNERGHSVTFYEPDAYERQKNRDIDDPEWAKVVVYQPTEESATEMLARAASADLIIKASGVGVLDAFLEKETVNLKDENTLIAFWDVDAPATLDSVENNPENPFRELIPQFDVILTYGGGEPVIKAYEKLNAKQCVPIYNALDTTTHHPVEPKPEFDADLVFLGNRLPDREARVEEFFLKVANLLPEKKFIIGGSGWGDKPMPANVKYIGHVYTRDHNAFNSSPRAILNISRESMARYGFSPATRVFEAAGAGACIVTDCWEGIDFFFEPGKEILVAKNGEEVASIMKNLTKEEARKIGNAAYDKVLSAHTYMHRVEQFDEVMSSLLKEKEVLA